MESLLKGASHALGFILLLYVIALVVPNPKDDTDPPDGRSGLTLHIDYRTGCHYISRLLSQPIPRLDREGNHICEGR